jgi:hypothetical protein
MHSIERMITIDILDHYRPDEELDGPVDRALRRAIAEVKQRWSIIGWVTKNLLSRVPPCFGRDVKPFVPAVL